MGDKSVAENMLPDSKYIWCLHCEQADIRTGWIHNYGYCPYEECEGTTLDGWAWEKVKQANPNYPETPDYDVQYPLYPQKRGE